jgi:hypothetical protein
LEVHNFLKKRGIDSPLIEHRVYFQNPRLRKGVEGVGKKVYVWPKPITNYFKIIVKFIKEYIISLQGPRVKLRNTPLFWW